MAIYGVSILLRGVWGLAFQAFRCESMPTPLNLTYILPFDFPCFARMHNSFTSVDLSTVDLLTCQPVNLSIREPVDLSTCRPVTCNMAIYWVFFILLRGSGVLAPLAFRCESMPTPLNLTYILPYDCPCFACMRNSFTSVDFSTVDLSTCRPVNLSTCRHVNLSTCQPVDVSTCQPVDLSDLGAAPRHSVVNQCLLH